MSKFRYAPGTSLRQTDQAQAEADRQRSRSKTVLNLADVLDMKKTDAERALADINRHSAEFAGQLTPELLKQFERRVGEVRRQHGIKAGIRPRTVIDRSRRIDIYRAQNEITAVQAVQFMPDGTIRFRTNASAKSKDTHHIVTVQFLDFQTALNGGRLTNRLAQSVLQGAVKFDCDCGRHRYWYRYIATIGGFNYRTNETAFPKVRNPELTGLGCKHVIRVMHSLQSTMMFTGAMKQFLGRYRKDPNAKTETLTKKRLAELEKKTLEKTVSQGKQIRRFKNADKVKTDVSALAETVNASKGQSAKIKKLQEAFAIGALTRQEYEQALKRITNPKGAKP